MNITGDLLFETGAIALNQWSENGAGNYSLTIQPNAATTRTIMGSCTAGSLVRFDGADRVNIDGRFNNAGTWLLFRTRGNILLLDILTMLKIISCSTRSLKAVIN
ncbi:MAG: hypothetical protein IPG08_17505 [Sphingobacteriaceae bacterium]|nr:hypothetical protein [Sphingobacteriaceae bacterium]